MAIEPILVQPGEYRSTNQFDLTELVQEGEAQLGMHGIGVQPLGAEQLNFALNELPDLPGEPGLKLVIGAAGRPVKVYLSPKASSEAADNAPQSVILGSGNFDPSTPGNLQFVAIEPGKAEREFGRNWDGGSERLGLLGGKISERQFGAALSTDGRLWLRDLGSRNGTRVLYGIPGYAQPERSSVGKVTARAVGRAAVRLPVHS